LVETDIGLVAKQRFWPEKYDQVAQFKVEGSMKRLFLNFVGAIGLLITADRAVAEPQALDVLAGEYTITNAKGETIGKASISVRKAGAVIEESRQIGDESPQLLWFAVLEHNSGWTQLFLSPAGLREFPLVSPKDAWPLIFGADVKLADGSPARFRLSISKEGEAAHRRLLEMSRNNGANWRPVFDYTYRRLTN
jgi:hypothetical protein